MRQHNGKITFLAVLTVVFVSVSVPAQNRVLDLDGANGFVELPAKLFANLTCDRGDDDRA